MVIKEFNRKLDGQKITCSIEGKPVLDAEIAYIGNSYYILNNTKSGTSCGGDNKRGYMYSWKCDTGNYKDLEINRVTNIVLKEYSYELW